jgi:hypothetical protein
VSTSDADIANALYADAYENIANTPMTNEQWAKAHEKAREYQETAKNTSTGEWFALVDKYYTTILPAKADNEEGIIGTKLENLVAAVEARYLA